MQPRSCRDRGDTPFEVGSCLISITCHRAHGDGSSDDYIGEFVEQIVRSPVGSLSFIEPVNSYTRRRLLPLLL